MKKCPDCAELVQDDARVCRHCRYEFSSTKRGSTQPAKQIDAQGWGCLAAICIGIILVFAVSSGGDPQNESSKTGERVNATDTSPTTKPANQYADAGKQIAWVGTGKESIKSQLKDPNSATFRNVHFYSGGGVRVVCGEVNARNGFGGYTGFERFVAAGTIISATESQVEGGLGKVWDKFCVKAPSDSI